MYRIVEKEALNPTVTRMVIEAPLVAQKAQPGQFIIFRASEDGERVPLTIADYDRKAGTVTIIFQIVGGATMELNALNAGDSLVDFVGPLGTPSKLEGLKKVAVVGGGPAGCEAALTAARRGHQVTLYEKRDFGGAMIEAGKPENKANIRRLIHYYEEHITRDPNISKGVRTSAILSKLS